MLPAQTDDHWLLYSLGLIAMVLQMAFSFVCAAFLVLPDATGGDTADAGVATIALLFGTAFALNIIQIFVHEMGHALAAWSVGRRVHLICVGILGYAPGIGKFMRVKKSPTAEYAGFVQASPVWPDLGNGKSIWISAAGPLATGGLGLLLLVSTNLTVGSVLAAFFLLDALVNLIPLRWTRGGGSDGLHILGYLAGHGWTPEMWAETRLSTSGFSKSLVSDQEWAELKNLRSGPFNSKKLNELIEKAARERNRD